MNDNLKLKNWLESLSPEKYQIVINHVFAEFPDTGTETLIEWLADNKKISLIAMCVLEKVSENCGVPFSFNNIEVALFRNILEDIWSFVNMTNKNATIDDKMEFARPILLYQAFIHERTFEIIRNGCLLFSQQYDK